MTCRAIHAFLSDYLAGELPRETRELFVRHLADCPSCRAYLASYRRTMALARAAGRDESPDVPEALVHAVLASCRAG